MSAFPGIRIEGGLLGPDVLDQLLAAELPGQRSADFGVDGRRSLTEEIAAVFADARALWGVFQHRLARLPEADLATSVTRDSWAIPFLGLLGYELHYNARAYDVDGLTFAISHRGGSAEDAPPVHIVGARQELGRLAPSGRPRLAPHSLLQEYLNRTEHLWGMVTNGLTLRLLRDSTYVRRQAYIEFDVAALLEEQRFQDFVVLYRLLHRTRLPRGVEDARDCLLEKYYEHSVEQGGRVRERLRDGVEECLKLLANGFLRHPANGALSARVAPGASAADRIPPEELYRQLLRLVYRFLFLLVSEDRGLISPDPLYREHYGVARLRRLLESRAAYTEHEDLWHSLRVLWRTLSDEKLAAILQAAPLNGELFAPLALDGCSITNRDLLEAFWRLAWYQDKPSSPPRRVNYAALDVEELGSVYESLLDYRPQIDASGNVPRFELAAGSERKSTGSYYTPPELVAELIHSALEPVLEERLQAARTQEEKRRAILSLRVCDPAAGSGHFLLAAARRLGKELARVTTGEDEPAPERVREAIREVVAHSIYGVDKNPLAVELCRVALWLEAHAEGKPLTFLDHRIRCGDSLVGVADLEALRPGIPDGAFTPVAGDDRAAAREARRANARERGASLFHGSFTDSLRELAKPLTALEDVPEDTLDQVRQKVEAVHALERSPEFARLRLAADVWTAAFFQAYPPDGSDPVTTQALHEALSRGHLPDARRGGLVEAARARQRFFHWPLAFPEVFAAGGFDVVLGNPPWEMLQPEEIKFFAAEGAAAIAQLSGARRKGAIQELRTTNPELAAKWYTYQRDIETANKFVRGGERFNLTAVGKLNTYALFAELARSLLNSQGCAGIIVPTGIATDDTCKGFFSELNQKRGLASLFDFENREALFPAVDSRMKFSLLTMSAKPAARAEFAFFLTRAAQLHDAQRRFTLTAEDLALLNPNTCTGPVFRTRADAELTKQIYQRVPVLVNERTGENPWGIQFLRMLDMANDSGLFQTAPGEGLVPLYEGKMVQAFDHRAASVVVDLRNLKRPGQPLETTHSQRRDANYSPNPQYWIPEKLLRDVLPKGYDKKWFVGFKSVTSPTNERTFIATILPWCGVGNSMPLMLPQGAEARMACCLATNLNGLVFDYVTRQKAGGVNLNFFIVNQLPLLPVERYSPPDADFVCQRVSELVYTAWDIKPFADDLWREAPESLRELIRSQWEENKAATGGHEWNPPAWAEIAQDGIPLAPFKWDEDRRARLRAELDAYYALLYGLTRKQLRYILDPADLTQRELEDILDLWEEVSDPLDDRAYRKRAAQSDFPGETFRVLKEKEMKLDGAYRTRRLVLEPYEKPVQGKAGLDREAEPDQLQSGERYGQKTGIS